MSRRRSIRTYCPCRSKKVRQRALQSELHEPAAERAHVVTSPLAALSQDLYRVITSFEDQGEQLEEARNPEL
jgi:hypothetical protein